MKRILGVALTAIGALSFIGSTCDLKSDECNYQDPASSYCTPDNVVVLCDKPGEEAHAREDRTPCATGTLCTLNGVHQPFCARNPSPPCDAGGTTCDEAGVVASKCLATLDGGSAWVDDNCVAEMSRSTSYTGKCATDADTYGIAECATLPFIPLDP